MLKRILLILSAAAAGVVVTLVCANHNWHPITEGAKANRILVEKGARRLTLFNGENAIKTYPVSLGRSPVGHKQQEDDDRTPEGSYSIDSRNAASACHLALHISYPKSGDRTGAANRGVSPGGDIMIHGILNGYGWLGAIHRNRDWTAGCIAVTDFEMDEIWKAVPIGTRIEIRP